MTSENHYSDAFWGTELCSSAGFDTLVKHACNGRTTCKSLANFICQRSKAEEEYARSIEKLNKTLDFSLELGTLQRGVELWKTSTDAIVKEHLEASKEFNSCAQNFTEFMKEQKKLRLKEQETLQKFASSKNQAYSRLLDAKKRYNQRSQDAENARMLLDQANVVGNNIPSAKVEKLIKDSTKSDAAAKQADDHYRTAVRTLNTERDKWERQMMQFAKFCEEQDIARENFLHNEMWNVSNTISDTCLKVDQHYEDVRNALDMVNITADLQEFIYTAQTGTERPAPVVFEPYVSQLSVSSSSSTLPLGAFATS